MVKSVAPTLSDRIRSALTPNSARMPDVRAVLGDAEQRLIVVTAALEAAKASIADPATSDTDLARLRLDVDELEMEAIRLPRAIETLTVEIARREADMAASQEAARASPILQARDALAEEMKAELPGIFARLVEYADRIRENDAALPRGEPSAEAVAGLSRTRLDEMKIPGMVSREERARIETARRAGELDEQARRQFIRERDANRPEAIRERLLAEDRRHALYYVQQEVYCGTVVHGIAHRDGSASIYNVDDLNPAEVLEMARDQVAAARARKIRVTPLPAEFKRYRVSNHGTYRGNAPEIETVRGFASIGNQGPVSVIMTDEQALAVAERPDFVVEPVGHDGAVARPEPDEDAESFPSLQSHAARVPENAAVEIVQ